MRKLFCLILSLALLTAALPACAIANPWTETTEEELRQFYSFNIPEDAEDVIYRRLNDLAEIQFTLDGEELCFRMQPTDGYTDISGMYYNWMLEIPAKIGWNEGKLLQAQDGENTVELCIWYDIVPGIMYTLSVVSPDLDGFDLEAVAMMMYVPMQTEADGFSFDELADTVFDFSSGVGAWYTEMIIAPDGSFSGTFSDSDMGETGDGYPNGTVYCCAFHGTLSVVENVASHIWKLHIDELIMDEPVSESIEDGIRYVVTDSVYGLEHAEDLLLYTPGIAISELPEGFLSWAHLEFFEEPVENLPFYGLYNEIDEDGFVGTEMIVFD